MNYLPVIVTVILFKLKVVGLNEISRHELVGVDFAINNRYDVQIDYFTYLIMTIVHIAR